MKHFQSLGNDAYFYLKNTYIIYELTVYLQAHKKEDI